MCLRALSFSHFEDVEYCTAVEAAVLVRLVGLCGEICVVENVLAVRAHIPGQSIFTVIQDGHLSGVLQVHDFSPHLMQ